MYSTHPSYIHHARALKPTPPRRQSPTPAPRSRAACVRVRRVVVILWRRFTHPLCELQSFFISRQSRCRGVLEAWSRALNLLPPLQEHLGRTAISVRGADGAFSTAGSRSRTTYRCDRRTACFPIASVSLRTVVNITAGTGDGNREHEDDSAENLHLGG